MLHRVAVLVGAAGVRVNIVVDAGETRFNRHSFGRLVTRQGGPADGLKAQPERVESVAEDGSQRLGHVALSARLRGGVIAQFGASSGAFGGAVSQAQFDGPGKHAGGVNRPALNLPGGDLAGGGEQVVLSVGARVVQREAGEPEGFFVAAGFHDVGDVRLAQVAQGEAFGDEFGLAGFCITGLCMFAVFGGHDSSLPPGVCRCGLWVGCAHGEAFEHPRIFGDANHS